MLLHEIDSTKPILYVDLDGVLADFFTPFNKMAGGSKWNQADKDTLQRTLKQIAQVDDFWPRIRLPQSSFPHNKMGVRRLALLRHYQLSFVQKFEA